MRPLELTRSGVIGTVAVFVVAVACVRLGLWQLERRSERLERNAAVAERLAAPSVALDRLPVDTVGLTYRRANVDGVVDDDRTLILAGRSHAGQPGVHVYSPVRLGEGAVLVNRGWLPAPDAATVDLAPIRRHDAARYGGVLLPFPDVSVERDRAPEFRPTWFRLDGDAIRAQSPYPLAPLYLLATEGPDTRDATGPLRLAPPTLDAGPHLSYAVQWFSFAAIFVIGWAALLLTRRGAGAGSTGTTDDSRPYQA